MTLAPTRPLPALAYRTHPILVREIPQETTSHARTLLVVKQQPFRQHLRGGKSTMEVFKSAAAQGSLKEATMGKHLCGSLLLLFSLVMQTAGETGVI